MRRIVTFMLAALVAAAVVTVNAESAAADDPNAVLYIDYAGGANGPVIERATCQTPYKAGVLHQYGAWGYYIDGCTVWMGCPKFARVCTASGQGSIATSAFVNPNQVTLNARLQLMNAAYTVLGWEDKSCFGRPACISSTMYRQLVPGQLVSFQCNGVREELANTASVVCQMVVDVVY